MKNNRKYKPLNEFRYNKKTKHMNLLFGTNGKKSKAIGFTTNEYTFNKKNMPLKYDIKIDGNKKSYVRNGVITDYNNNFSHISKSYRIHEEDKSNVKSKIRKIKRSDRKFWH